MDLYQPDGSLKTALGRGLTPIPGSTGGSERFKTIQLLKRSKYRSRAVVLSGCRSNRSNLPVRSGFGNTGIHARWFFVGVGGFDDVYKGYIDNGTVPLAIKRLMQGSKEFEIEIKMLSHFRHHHLVSLIAYCNNDNEIILVYEFMAHGTFREHLYNSENQPLSCNQKLEICLGAARGLHYLQAGAKHAIIHCDITLTNILIDENWMAKIFYFGLSRMGPWGISRCNINISTLVKGSIGYMDLEYYTCQILMDKSDVFLFGVELLEVLYRRPPILRAVDKERQNLVEWFRKCVDQNDIYETLGPNVRGSIKQQCLNAYTEIALKCLANNGKERPSMGDVMLGLESLMESLNEAEKTKLGGTLNEEVTVEEGIEEVRLDVDEIERRSKERALIRKATKGVERREGFASSDGPRSSSNSSKLTRSSSEHQS
ncbi:receptor-like protein kinase FERONIA [Neltuma alba]|uniref:receptor-like protein kinase FERONIA n=1 Tax=Neltuma alba TaxID=207710 RepID=UPI0010A52B6F|nr:receptor-like protein kinase FERONIA [Prosopis alba]